MKGHIRQRGTKSWSVTIVLLILFITLAMLFALTSCGDGALYIKGTVYAWVNAPVDAKSTLLIKNADSNFSSLESDKDALKNQFPADAILVPLNEAKVQVGIKKYVLKDTSAYIITANSDENGDFSGDSGMGPGKFTLLAKVSKEGYADAIAEKVHDSLFHEVISVLVKVR